LNTRFFRYGSSFKDENSQGSILLVVLCVIAILSFLLITTAALSNQHGEMQQARQGRMRARQLAEMGVAVAAHPLIQPGDPLLQRNVSSLEQFTVFMTTEESRLNLNALLVEGRQPLLERVFSSWGLSPADSQAVVASLMDWTDADDLKRRPDSAERLDYEHLGFPDRPFNRMLSSLDEVMLVARAEEIQTANPAWRSFFTLRGNGQLDVNTAAADVLASLTGAMPENARQLVRKRNGPDGLPFTLDDTPLQSLEEAMALLGLAGAQAEGLKPVLTLHGTTLRIESIGTVGDARFGIAVLLHKDGGIPRLEEWREFPVKAPGQL